MILAAIIILWIAYCLLDGYAQGHYYDLHPTDKKHPNIHWAFMVSRAIVLSGAYGTLDGRISVWDNIIFIFGLIFIFSFFHNGEYYATRNNLNPKVYPKRWWSNSETSQAVFEFNVGFRTAMAVMGLLFITATVLQNQQP
jgi:hypothetical protein